MARRVISKTLLQIWGEGCSVGSSPERRMGNLRDHLGAWLGEAKPKLLPGNILQSITIAMIHNSEQVSLSFCDLPAEVNPKP